MNAQWDDMAVTDATPKLSRHHVSEWVRAAFDHFPEWLIRNAWTNTGYAWFDKLAEDSEEEENNLIGEEDKDEDKLVLHMVWSNTNNSIDEGEKREDDIGGNINGIMATV